MVEVIVKKGRKARKATKNCPAVEATPDITKMVAKKVRIGGKGGISEKIYKTLQQYYGNAIREHAGDLEGMIKACWAVYYHSVSAALCRFIAFNLFFSTALFRFSAL